MDPGSQGATRAARLIQMDQTWIKRPGHKRNGPVSDRSGSVGYIMPKDRFILTSPIHFSLFSLLVREALTSLFTGVHPLAVFWKRTAEEDEDSSESSSSPP
jgi:hypothetical protein